MGDILFELGQVFKSKQHKLTAQESDVLMTCESRALKALSAGAVLGGGFAYLATSRLQGLNRVVISAGVSALVGFWQGGRSLGVSVDQMLELEGSVMQRELANIMIRKHRDNPRRMRIVYKHFYSEEVFDDLNAEKPMQRWRYRNFFIDSVGHSQRENESNTSKDSEIDSQSDSQDEYSNDSQSGSPHTPKEASVESERRKFNSARKRAPKKSVSEETDDALDCVFGVPVTEEIHRANPSTTSLRSRIRKERRAHRRRRIRHQNDILSNPPKLAIT